MDAQNAQISPQSQSNYYKGIAYYSQASGKIFLLLYGFVHVLYHVLIMSLLDFLFHSQFCS